MIFKINDAALYVRGGWGYLAGVKTFFLFLLLDNSSKNGSGDGSDYLLQAGHYLLLRMKISLDNMIRIMVILNLSYLWPKIAIIDTFLENLNVSL